MRELLIYGSLLISALAGIFLGWHLAYVLADGAKASPRKTIIAKPPDETAKKPRSRKEKVTHEAETICLKDKIKAREGASLTAFECDETGDDEAEIIDAHQQKSNDAYNYLKNL